MDHNTSDTRDHLIHTLDSLFETASDTGKDSLTVTVADLHNAGEADGNLPGDTMAEAEQVLRAAMGPSDAEVGRTTPGPGNEPGDDFAVRFALPRG